MCKYLRHVRIRVVTQRGGEMQRLLKCVLITVLITGILWGLFVPVVAAEVADHVVISEIQTDSINGTGGTDDDWIEIYNPTGSSINLSGWHLGRDSNGGNSLTNEMEISSGTISSYGFFLIVSDDADTSLKAIADAEWAGLTFDDGDVLYLASTDITNSNPQNDPDIIDILGLDGCSPSSDAEGGAPAPNPPAAQSLQRKFSASGTTSQSLGPAWDTDNNSADFFIQTSPNPQNSSEPGPIPPFPEFSAITLFSLGLLALCGYLWLRKNHYSKDNHAC